MENGRKALAIASFVVATVLVVQLFAKPFSGTIFFIAAGLYLAAYFLWPGKRRHKQNNDWGVWDIVELIIEFPVELVVWLLRFIWRVLRAILRGLTNGLDFDV